jgi:anti-sigma regulatory factor (Ser/Thr protein kinase)
VIDLAYSRERMLADIGSPPDAAPVGDLADPRARAHFVERDAARLVARVHAPQDILPSLDAALAARFAAVEPARLQRNLLLPLKKALGNAHKRGNRLDPAKCIALEVVVTRRGAFVEVSDEGEGFDVAGTCARFRTGERYFAHGGSGFRKFEKARAVVSFDDGGRTFRVRFRAEDGDTERSGERE